MNLAVLRKGARMNLQAAAEPFTSARAEAFAAGRWGIRVAVRKGGAVVLSETDGNGPAAKAGLLQDDVILQVNGQPLREAGALQQAVLQAAPGDALTLTIRRDGRERRLKVTLGVRRPQ